MRNSLQEQIREIYACSYGNENLFVFTENDPLNGVDYLGLDCQTDYIKAQAECYKKKGKQKKIVCLMKAYKAYVKCISEMCDDY